MAGFGSTKQRLQSQFSKVEVCYLRGRRLVGQQTKDTTRLSESKHRPDMFSRTDSTDPRRLNHKWESVLPGGVRTKGESEPVVSRRRMACARCGIEIEVERFSSADSVARNLGIPDDCDEAVAYNIHVT